MLEMKTLNRFFLLSIVLLLVAPVLAGEGKVMGKGLADFESVAVSELLGNPEKYVGKKVRVEGKIADVCPRMGCWIDIASKGGSEAIRFKVKDGVIVFPTEIKGKGVVAEGVFTKIEMTEEEALSWAKHLAEEKGEEFDADNAEIATAYYRIDGKGARVQ